MTAVVFEDPPSPPTVMPSGRIRWSAVLDEIRRRPGQWARLPCPPLTWNEAHDRTSYLRSGCRRRVDVTGFEFRRGRLPDATHIDFCWAVWARFTPSEEDTP